MDLHETCDLGNGYYYNVDMIDKNEWSDLLAQFDDANIYQALAYNEVRSGRENISNLVIYNGDKIVAAAQVRIFKIPVIKSGIAYIRWGPLWRLKGCEENINIFRHILRAIRKEFVVNRGLSLRIFPRILMDGCDKYLNVIKEEGYCLDSNNKHRTILLNIEPSITEIRGGLRRRWRQYLVNAEKSNFHVKEGAEIDFLKISIDLYDEMNKRKKFIKPNDETQLINIQQLLENECKLVTLLCYKEDVAVSTMVISAFGDTVLPIMAATGNKGIGNDSSYLVWWKMLEWSKQRGYKWIDLGGINPEKNKGSYLFKTGISKTHGREVEFIGYIDCFSTGTLKNIISTIGLKLVAIMK